MKTRIHKQLALASIALVSACALNSCSEKEEAKPTDASPAVTPGSGSAPTPPPAPPVVVYYSVELAEIGPNKINVIKTLRAHTPGMKLRDAKQSVDAVEDGKGAYTLAEKLNEADANALKAKFEETGATITVNKL